MAPDYRCTVEGCGATLIGERSRCVVHPDAERVALKPVPQLPPLPDKRELVLEQRAANREEHGERIDELGERGSGLHRRQGG